MDADDRERLAAYARSQNNFQGISTDIAMAMLEAFIRRALPWLATKIYEAVSTAWDYVKKQLGW